MTGLCIVILGQFVLLPLIFTRLVHDPYHTGEHVTAALTESLLQFEGLTVSSSSGSSSSESTLKNPRRVQRRKERLVQERSTADGTFNGAPIYLKKNQPFPFSNVHCVGENYREDAWKHRSCRFTNLCFNMTSHDFVVFQSFRERLLSVYMAQRKHMHSSTTLFRYGANNTQSVSIGGLNQKWGADGMERLKWFPKVIPQQQNDSEAARISYYELPPEMVMVPFHSMNGANPGHLVWDDFLPIYTLLDMFQMSSYDDFDLLPLRYVLQDGERGLWASCDLREEKREDCNHMMNKFMSLLLGTDSPVKFSSTKEFEFQPKDTSSPPVELICAKTGAAGLGPLTDHGLIKSHGWEETDYELTHNHGRGGQLYRFRNFMLNNIGIDPTKRSPGTTMTMADGTTRRKRRIVFSQKSSDIFIRSMDFERQLELVRSKFPDHDVENYILKELTVEQQMQIANDADIFVTLCGGGAVTAMFLPKGASVIVYYSEDSGVKNGIMNGKPALLDWDLFNSMSHLRVHWLPRNTMKGTLDEKALTLLIRHEIDIMDSSP